MTIWLNSIKEAEGLCISFDCTKYVVFIFMRKLLFSNWILMNVNGPIIAF